MLIFERMNGSWYATRTGNKTAAGELVHGHHRGMAEQAPKLNAVTYTLAGYRDYPYCRGFLVHHSNCALVGYNTGNCLGGCGAGDGNHIQTH